MNGRSGIERGLYVGEGTVRGTILRTERLLLRPFKQDDVDEALNYRNDAEFARFLPHIPQPFTRADAEQFVTTNVEEPWDKFSTFAIELDARLIGTVNLDIDSDNQIAMLGYAISRDRWGKGITPEAARAVISWGFQTLNLAKIWASTDARHQRSRRVMEKLGMRHEGTLRAHHLGWDGLRTDQVMYGLLREEWEATANPPSAGTN
jgi:[ribosomal protein S5]-alanine N-acetyltransferase